MTKKACILYGFAEGPKHGARMRQALTDRGYQIITDQKGANLVIAHSGAYLLIDTLQPKQRVMIIDASCHTGRLLIDNALRHLWYDVLHVLGNGSVYYYFWKTWWNIVYFYTRPFPAVKMYRHLHNPDYQPLRFRNRAVITQGDDRSWYNPNLLPTEELIL